METINCTKCQAQNSSSSKFCSQCGSPLNICPKCGNALSEYDLFCSNCGHGLTSKTKETANITVEETETSTPTSTAQAPINESHEAPAERRDLVSIIQKAENKSGGCKSISIIRKILKVLVIVTGIIVFLVSLAISGIFSIVIPAIASLFSGDVGSFFVSLDIIKIFNLLLNCAIIPILIIWGYNTVVENAFGIGYLFVLYSWIKKTGYDKEETLEVFEKPDLISPQTDSADTSTKAQEKRTEEKLQIKAGLGMAHTLYPFLENTAGKAYSVIGILIDTITLTLYFFMVMLFMIFTVPLGDLINLFISNLLSIPEPSIGYGIAPFFGLVTLAIVVYIISICSDKLNKKIEANQLKLWKK